MLIKGWVTALTVAFGVLVAIAVVFAYLRLYTRQQQNFSEPDSDEGNLHSDSIDSDKKDRNTGN
ncbi:hypothetical protein [Paenibacillus herberti]|uniref:Uncharacterized protein n=1 Tax=Paenibacillus herberti TaxID=1619309 RepID=A0A229NW81_9BACL|nr:hypothetical protein [Paenibacillus herberti]OXM14054.1 hypothetical protein CGZ75_13770 [Paenibacillus herberti]